MMVSGQACSARSVQTSRPGSSCAGSNLQHSITAARHRFAFAISPGADDQAASAAVWNGTLGSNLPGQAARCRLSRPIHA